ncbi:hypothetical protein F444_22353 [Phytophthora nicotianae P1976]|uniref:Uncharacterized protein n=1 Tax=Phytophthora nicotianae P1976 TaxID=1317066 RepID=A0A080YY15_PHYNI|nr:hypothetical protein F444_22353 [Phytophthora nicotianae P1976]
MWALVDVGGRHDGHGFARRRCGQVARIGLRLLADLSLHSRAHLIRLRHRGLHLGRLNQLAAGVRCASSSSRSSSTMLPSSTSSDWKTSVVNDSLGTPTAFVLERMALMPPYKDADITARSSASVSSRVYVSIVVLFLLDFV